MLLDGAYCDGTFQETGSGIGVVMIRQGQVLHVYSEKVPAESSHRAECMAICRAREMYPDEQIFTDSTSAADELGATWIKRKHNWHAHHAAHDALSRNPTLRGDIEYSIERANRCRTSFNGRWKGRGCIGLRRDGNA